MAASDDSGSGYRWAIELEDIEFAGVDTTLSDVCCVKAIQMLTPPRVASCAARVELVPFPENYQLAQDTQFAEVLEWPEDATLPASTVVVKTVGTHDLPLAPAGMVFLDTVRLPSIPGGIAEYGTRVPVIQKSRGGIAEFGIRVPVIKRGIIGKK
jgi:hypothetical protein